MADRYLVSGGTGDYDSTTNWSTTSGGASGASKPVAADRILIDTNSLNAPLTINTPNACLSFSASNYTGTININSTLSVNGANAAGNIILSTGMTITGSGSFVKIPTGTTGSITSNSAIFDCNFIFQTSATTTTAIIGTMQVNKNLTWSLNSPVVVNNIVTGTILVGGDVIHNSQVGGNGTVQLIGSTPATITQIATRYFGANLVINKTGIWNQVNLYFGSSAGRTFTYTAGIPNFTGILFTQTFTTLNSNGIIWGVINHANSNLNLTSTCNAHRIEQTGSTNIVFGGTHGFNINELQFAGSNGGQCTFTSGITYKINTSVICFSPTVNRTVFRCISGVNAIVELKEGAYMKLLRVAFSRITASNKTLRGVNSTVDSFSKNVFNLSSNINPYSTTR
jgi:hypothetical protein